MELLQAVQMVAADSEFRVLRRVPERFDPPAVTDGETGLALIIDTETTGMDKQHDQIIEVGMLLVRYRKDTGEWLALEDQYDGLEDPDQPLSRVVQTVTGLTDGDLAGQKMDDGRVNALARRADLVIAHNAAFDRPFLERRWPVFGEMAFACSLSEIDWMAAGFASAKLELLVYHRGYFYDSHRALNDCWALAFVLGQVLEPQGTTALATLLASADKPSFLLNLQVRFDDKDKLKALGGFQWQDGGDSRFLPKSWLRRCKDKAELRAVLDSIYDEVFAGKSFPCHIGKLSAHARYAINWHGVTMRSYQFPAPDA